MAELLCRANLSDRLLESYSMVRSLSGRSGDGLAIGTEGSAKACKLWPINRRDQAGAGVVLMDCLGSASG